MKKSILVITALMVWAQVAWGQCSNGPCYTANPPAVTRLTPAQYAAQGDGRTNVAGTITVTILNATDANGNSGTTSKTVAVTPGTKMRFDYTSINATSAVYYYKLNSDPTQRGLVSTPLSGSFTWTASTGDVGYTYHNFFAPSNSSNGTLDRTNVTVVAGNVPSIVSQDKVPENTIIHFHASGGGGSMLNDFTMCQLDPRHCINATHTPYTTLAVSNLTSGEAQNHLKHISGNIAKQNESVSFGDDMFFSALPEDVFTYSEDDEVDCSVSGPVGVPPVKMDIRFERAITEEYISSIINSNGMHPEHIYCIIAATPPDFPGADEALPGTPSGQIVNIAFLYREWPINTQEKGVQWQLVFPDIQEVGIGYYVKTTMEPDPSGCTMWDNGFRHLPLPTPLDPQPQ